MYPIFLFLDTEKVDDNRKINHTIQPTSSEPNKICGDCKAKDKIISSQSRTIEKLRHLLKIKSDKLNNATRKLRRKEIRMAKINQTLNNCYKEEKIDKNTQSKLNECFDNLPSKLLKGHL
jgi:hypothetical protein